MTWLRADPDDARAGPRPTGEPVWTTPVDQVVARFGTDAELGLEEHEAVRRRSIHGPNEIPPAAEVPAWRHFLGHLADPVVYLLLAAIVVSLVAWLVDGAEGLPLDALVIAAIVVVNAGIGFLQERRAEEAVAALRTMTRQEATVVRDGVAGRRPAVELVPGDMVLLAGGDVVPADARLVEANALRTAEAAVTGESAPVTKSIEPVAAETALGDRRGMVFSGTIVASGRGRAVVTATGSDTEVGRIAAMLEETEPQPTPLQREIARVGRVLGAAVVAIAVVIVATLILVGGVRTGSGLVDALLIGVSLAVAAVPEGLPAVLSVVLALGVQRMSRRNALVKRLVSVEALGSATVICSDKTGTLTRNEMMVRRLVVPSGDIEVSGSGYDPAGRLLVDGDELVDPAVVDEARWALIGAGLASDATVGSDGDGRYVAVGDPMEAALVTAQHKAGLDLDAVGRRFMRTAEIPFTSRRQRMSTINVDREDGDRLVLAVKGAPDRLLERCRSERVAGQSVALDEARRRWWLEAVDRLAGRGLRTLAVAYRPLDRAELGPEPGAEADEGVENELVLLGVVGIIDPPRAEARPAVDLAQQAGIRVAMITGDHPSTAATIAAELGIAGSDRRVVTGPELAAASDDELVNLVGATTVYARVAPEHKLRIVQTLVAQGEVVAMTGDGVNDAPALKAASIGVAMGVTGTDVSKETADMILADDNFATIVAAVREGRAIFDNIRSFLRYLLSSNIGEVLTVFLGVVGASLIGLSDVAEEGVTAPLLAVQILWINLVTDSGPALALGVDPPQPGLMDRHPRRLGQRIIDRRMQVGIGIIGLAMAVSTLAMLDLKLAGGVLGGPWLGGDGDLETARTAAFTVLVLAQLFNTVNARSDVDSIVGRLLVNRWLLAAVGLSLALQVAVVYVPWLHEPFGTASLSLADWVLAIVLASSVVVVSELRKLVVRRVDRGALDPVRRHPVAVESNQEPPPD